MAVTVALCALGGLSFMVRRPDPAGTAAAHVRELDESLRKALVVGDVQTIDSILAAPFELVDPSGDRQTRDEYVNAVSSGSLDYEKFDPITPVDVRVSGDVAVVTYQSQLQVAAGPVRLHHKAWHTHVYEEAGGRWWAVWSQATAVGGFPPVRS